MKSLFLSSVFLLNIFVALRNETVYVSMGCSAYAYHVNYNCSRLKRCREEGHVKKVTLDEARGMKRKACKVCTEKRR